MPADYKRSYAFLKGELPRGRAPDVNNPDLKIMGAENALPKVRSFER